ncbi:hypothetical protein HAX54_042993, partial [Datura stramonium]|nr:hypothetical protein [Datura stramonium]
SSYNASSHCQNSCFTGASRVRIGEMLVWRQMSDFFYPVFGKAPAAHRCLAGLHQWFAGAANDEIFTLQF